MKKFAAFLTAALVLLSAFALPAAADTLELAEIYSEYGRGETIFVQGTTDQEGVMVYLFGPQGEWKYFKSVSAAVLYEGISIGIGENWEMGEYELRVGYGSAVINEYHFDVVEEPVDHSPSSSGSSGSSGKTITATSISISPASLELKVGESAAVEIISENSSVKWETDDSDKISISGTKTATITAKKTGTATAWAYSGNNYATLTVKISPADKKTESSGAAAGTDTGAAIDKTDAKAETEEAAEPKEALFTDLEGVSWARESINALAEAGIVNGMGGGIFAPEQNVTRAQFVKMIVEAFGFEGKGDAAFSDVSDGDWFAEYVLVAANNGIVNGYGEAFGPNDNISCRDAALIVKRVLAMKGFDLPEAAAVEEGAEYAGEAVGQLRAAEIITDEMDFKPTQKATRAQSAYLIYGAYKLKAEAGDANGEK